jgi:hypothetical protein
LKRLKLNITDLPAFVYYLPEQNRYHLLEHPYNTRNVMGFIGLVKDGKKTKKVKIEDQLDLKVPPIPWSI